MKAVQLTDYGSVDNFRMADIPEPQAGPNQVRIKVAFAGLRWGDVMARNGDPVRRYTPPFAFTAGQEAAGVVDQVGEGVENIKIGQRLYINIWEGAFAEYAIVTLNKDTWARDMVPIPDGVPMDVFLAYPVNMMAAWMAVYQWGQVKPGQTVLLHQAAGGLGRLITQIIKRKLWDVRLISLVGSDAKFDVCRADGADHVINYKTHNYVDEVQKIIGEKPVGFLPGVEGAGVDVSFNGVRAHTLKTDPLIIRKRGRWVLYGHAGAARDKPIDGSQGRRNDDIDTAPFLYDSITILPMSTLTWLGTPEWFSARAFMYDWLARQALMTPTVYALDEVPKAQELMETGQTTGKVVFRIGGEP